MGSVWLDCPEEEGEGAQEGAGARAGFRKREGNGEEGLPALLALQEGRKERR